MIKKSLMRVQEYLKARRALKESVVRLLENPDWRAVERDIRNSITALYRQLGSAQNEKDLHRIQAALTARVEFFQDFYRLAGISWTWAGYRDYATAEEEVDEESIKAETENAIHQRAMQAAQS